MQSSHFAVLCIAFGAVLSVEATKNSRRIFSAANSGSQLKELGNHPFKRLRGQQAYVGIERSNKSASRIRTTHSVMRQAPTVTLELTNFGNVQYYATIWLGGQWFPAIFDTGSFEIMVLSAQCQNCQNKGYTVPLYNQQQSTTFKAGGGAEAIHVFGSGPVKAHQDYEKVTLANGPQRAEIADCPFWEITSHNLTIWDNGGAGFSAIVGMSHLDTVPGKALPGVTQNTMVQMMGVTSFAICLKRGLYLPGTLIISPADVISAPMFGTTNVIGAYHWGTKMTRVELGLVPNVCDVGCAAILDSGSSLIGAPKVAMEALNPVLSTIASDCSNVLQMPNLVLQLEGVALVLPPEAYVLEVQSYPEDNTTQVTRQCTAAFMEVNRDSQHGPIWILGMPILRQYYTVFDRGAKKIHFAKADDNCAPVMDAGFHLKHAGPLPKKSSGFDLTKVDMRKVRMPTWAQGTGPMQV